MKVFEITYVDRETQWVAAETNIEALREVLNKEATDLDLMEDIQELPEERLDTMTIQNTEFNEDAEEDGNNWEYKTFRDILNECKSSEIISATFYDL